MDVAATSRSGNFPREGLVADRSPAAGGTEAPSPVAHPNFSDEPFPLAKKSAPRFDLPALKDSQSAGPSSPRLPNVRYQNDHSETGSRL